MSSELMPSPYANFPFDDLFDWYDQHGRDLPWRHRWPTLAPVYHLWLSEIMLQQTVVATVIPYFLGFIRRWPTVGALAAAPVDEVLAAWAGLGYYARARNLHKTANIVAAEHGGVFPADQKTLLALPGIGPYTAAAVASIAFGQSVACVDGNIRRVMARRTAQADPTPKQVQAWADAAIHLARPGDWNQALMELGATVCTPKRWNCGGCPVRASCVGKENPGAFPAPKKLRVTSLHLVAVVEFALDGHPVLHQRPMTGIFAGLWGPVYHEEAPIGLEDLVNCGTVNHQLSHRKIEVQVHLKHHDLAIHGTPRSGVALSSLDEKVLTLASEYANANPPSSRFEAKG